MKLGTLSWSDVKGEGNVRLGNTFQACDFVVRLDAITDWIHQLKRLYEAELVALERTDHDPALKAEETRKLLDPWPPK